MTADASKIVSGPGLLESLQTSLHDLGATKVVLLCGPNRRFVDEALAGLGSLPVTVFDGAAVHVPQTVVDDASALVAKTGADTIVALGGGAAIGLGKALRLQHSLHFVAIPTTYAGSEMTRIWGVTDGGRKRTGRDDRVRPDLVILDPTLATAMPRTLTVQSLLNALAHPVSALSRASAGSEDWDPALAAIRRLVGALTILVTKPEHRDGRWLAMRGTTAAARVLDNGELGTHHTVAHVLGGRFGLPHATLHSILLPAFIADLRRNKQDRYAAISKASAQIDIVALLHDALKTVGAPTGLRQLDLSWSDIRAALNDADVDPLEHDWVRNAFLGRRLAADTRQEQWIDGAPALTRFGPALAHARKVVVALHGRGGTADSVIRTVRECIGDAPDVAIVAPQAEGARWYSSSYREAAGTEELAAALQTADKVITRARQEAGRDHDVVIFGYSQGACLALETVARLDAPVGGVVALSGARVGPADWVASSEHLSGVPMVVGLSQDDPWASRDDLQRSVDHFRGAGAEVVDCSTTGDAHAVTGRQRIATRALICGVAATEHGFGNAFEVENLPGALPRQQNSPHHVPYGLTAEQINGSGFVAPRDSNVRSWLYRVRPPPGHRPFTPLPHATLSSSFVAGPADPNLAAFAPLPLPDAPTDFVDGLHTIGGAGDPSLRRGYAVHVYAANRSMEERAFVNADGDFVVLPQLGTLTLLTELGSLTVAPGELAIVPRGFRFSVLLHDAHARGYVGEVFGQHFTLPDRGPVGANGLADARHFRAPVPYHENRLAPGYRVTVKLGAALSEHTQDHSVHDVVAWHGNYTPMAYDMRSFSPVSGVRIDHSDPSIYTVLSAPLDEPGSHALDLVVFPPRWDPTEHTFRPPYFHRNGTMEINGIVREVSSPGSTFTPGMIFTTPPMSPHGVVSHAVDRFTALSEETGSAPHRTSDDALWFQFETALPMTLSDWARDAPERIDDWHERWGVYTSRYDPSAR